MTTEFTYPNEMTNRTRRQYDSLLWTIHIDGPFEEPNGSATQYLVEAIEDRGLDISKAVLATMLRELDKTTGKFRRRIIRRDLNEKRCYKIELAIDPAELPELPRDFDPNPVPVRHVAVPDVDETTPPTGDDILARLRGISDEERAEMAREEEGAQAELAVPAPAPAPVPVPARLAPAVAVPVSVAGAVVDVDLPVDTNGHRDIVPVAFVDDSPVSKLFAAMGLLNDVALTVDAGDSAQLAGDLARARREIATLTRANEELRRLLGARTGISV